MTRITAPTPTLGKAPSHAPPDVHYAPGINLVRALGWVSIGLGAVELLAPREVARATGVRHPSLVRACGVRELVTGVGLLSGQRPTGWMWARVAGDAVDLALLGESIATGRRRQRERAALAAVAVAGITALDVFASAQLTTAALLEG